MSSKTLICEKSVDLDEVLDKFALFGWYHGLAVVLLLLTNVSNSINGVNYIFTAMEVSYRCNDTKYNVNASGLNSSIYCEEWIYDNPDSFVAEFGLAGQEWKRTLVGTAHSLGYMVGLLIVGPMSDRLGRRKSLVITGVLGGIIGLARSVSPWYWVYIALEFLESVIGDICSPSFMLGVEMVSTKKRVPFTMIATFGFAIGGVVLALLAWLFPYYRTLLRVIYAPTLLFFLYSYLIDESPRWLLIKGKKEEVKKNLKNAAKKNKFKINEDMLANIKHEKSEEVKFLNLLKSTFESKALLKRFLVCVVWWITSTFVNYGMTINTVSLQGNKYINFALISAIDIPGTIVLIFILKYFKRKTSLICCFLFGAVMCLVQPFVSSDLPWLSILVYMVGKLLSTIFFSITYIYTSELFPTYTRNSMHALCSSLGRVGSIVAPQTPLLMTYWPGLPTLIFGGMALLAGILTFMVPDTSDAALPDTVQQAEAIGIEKKPSRSTIEENVP